jgi:CRISPR-associated protein Cas1
MLSNLYLDHLDEVLLDHDLCLIRFADDFLILCKSQARATQALELTDEVLSDLRLKLNSRKTRIVNFDQGFRFLGAEFIRSLLLKSEYAAEPPLFSATQLITPAIPEPPPPEPQTPMQIAFAEANISSHDFSGDRQGFADLAYLDEAEQPADNDPLLRTLYLLQHGQVLAKESERLVVRQEHKVVREIPAIKVDQIMVFGNAQITTQAMQFCLQERIPIYLLSGQGQYYGVIDSFSTEPVLLQRAQFLRATDPVFCLTLSIAIVYGKIANSRLMLQRLARSRSHPAYTPAIETLKLVLTQLAGATSLDELRGFEGNAAKVYFQAVAASLENDWGFSHRVRQPPTDAINAMLSYGYTLLFYNLYSLLRSRGLNPQVGFFHAVRPGHPALASDMMEEFRALVVDAVVWKLVFNRKLTPEDFDYPQQVGQGCYLKPPARLVFIKALEEKLNSSVTHPQTGLSLDYRRCMEYQAQLLAEAIRGKAAGYQALQLR